MNPDSLTDRWIDDDDPPPAWAVLAVVDEVYADDPEPIDAIDDDG